MMKSGSISFCIADVRINVLVPEPIWLYESRQPYLSFINDGYGLYDVLIYLTFDLICRPKRPLFSCNNSWAIYQKPDGWVIAQENNNQINWCLDTNIDFSIINFFLSRQAPFETKGKFLIENPFCYPLDQILLMNYFSRNQISIIHSAGLLIGDETFLFPGISGSGKSTLIRQFMKKGNLNILSDERIIVRKKEGFFRGYGTPWPGDAGAALNESGLLGGIFFINHAKSNEVKDITSRKAFERLIPVVSIPWYNRDVIPNMLDFIEDIVKTVPVFELQFRPDTEVVSFLEDFVTKM